MRVNDIFIGSKGTSIFWICDDYKLYIHGRNDVNQLGIDPDNDTNTPILAANVPPNDQNESLLHVIGASCNEDVSMILCNDGSVWSSGRSWFGEHGHCEIRQLVKFTRIDIKDRIKKV